MTDLCANVLVVPDDTSRFQFSIDTHRELAFADEAELMRAAHVLFDDRTRTFELTEAECLAYARDAVAAGHAPWREVGQREKWQRYLRRPG